MEHETADLEISAAELRRRAWLLGEFWAACRAVDLPDHLAAELVADYHRDELLAGVIYEDDE